MENKSPERTPSARGNFVDVMDCTLRDGSYAVDFQFTADDTRELVRGLTRAGVRWIEVGHGSGLGAQAVFGAAAATDEEYIVAALEGAAKTAKVGCFYIPGLGKREGLLRARELGMDFVRIGTNASEIEKGLAEIAYARELGFTVSSNLMKSYVLTPFDVCRAAKKAESAGAHVVSLVDSAGGMLPDEVALYVRAMAETVGCAVGFHGHNNLGLANACSLAALQNGASMIDSTLQGMGRSTGNAWTESMLMIYKKIGFKSGVDCFQVMDVGEKLIRPRLGRAGFSSIEVTSGFARFHSSYMKHVDEAASAFEVDPRSLIIEVSKINKNNPNQELFFDAAAKLARLKTTNPVTFPTILPER